MLMALADGRALPAGELAATAGLSLSGASAHLTRLTQGGLIMGERQGRHRYYRLAGPQVAAALEALAPLAAKPNRRRTRSPATEALRQGRTCYDHLAGELGVALADGLERRGLLAPGDGKRLNVTDTGRQWFAEALGIDCGQVRPGRHGVACRCLDWTERRYHVAGPLGAALLRRCRALGWVIGAGDNRRAVGLSPSGAAWMRDAFGVTLPATNSKPAQPI